MQKKLIHSCQCSICLGTDANPTREVHRAMNFLFAQLDDRQKTLYIGLEAKKRGPGSENGLSLIVGWDEQAIAMACMELEQQVNGEISPENGAGQEYASATRAETSNDYQAKIAMAYAFKKKINRLHPHSGYHK